jgi:hypothetical protein
MRDTVGLMHLGPLACLPLVWKGMPSPSNSPAGGKDASYRQGILMDEDVE